MSDDMQRAERLKAKRDYITSLLGAFMKEWADAEISMLSYGVENFHEKEKQLTVMINYLQKAQKALTQWEVRTGK